MTKTYFVTGTDTDVGKTYISCGLLATARCAGFSTAAIKPVAAGGVSTDSGLRNSDALALQKQCSLALNYSQINPVLFEQAIAPHIAAKQSGRDISISQLVHSCRDVMELGADLTLIEGAGGWLVPLNEQELMSDFVVALGVPVILVVGIRLGCINHALLTVRAIEGDGVRIAGWVANGVEVGMEAYLENVETLRGLLGVPMVGEIGYVGGFSDESNCEGEFDISLVI